MVDGRFSLLVAVRASLSCCGWWVASREICSGCCFAFLRGDGSPLVIHVSFDVVYCLCPLMLLLLLLLLLLVFLLLLLLFFVGVDGEGLLFFRFLVVVVSSFSWWCSSMAPPSLIVIVDSIFF